MRPDVYKLAKPVSDKDPFLFVMSDESVDRVGDVIEAAGWDLSDFKGGSSPIALFNHRSDSIVGKWTDVRVEGKKLLGKLVLADRGTSELVDTVWKLWDQKILRSVSVGFKWLERKPLTKESDEWFGPFRFIRQKLLECSLVAVPANPNAKPVVRGLVLSDEIAKEITRQVLGVPAKRDPGDSRVPASPPARTTKMTLSQRIQAAQNELVALKDKLTELAAVENPSDAENDLIDEINNNQMPEATKKLERLQAMERSLAAGTQQRQDPEPGREIINPAAGQKPFALPKLKIEPHDYVYRALSAWATSVGGREPIEKVLRDRYGGDELTNVVLRAATNPATTTAAGWAAELTQSANLGFLDRLIPNSIYQALVRAGERFSFGNNAQLKIPGRSTSNVLAGSWVGEGAAKPVKRASLVVTTLSPYKLAVISVFTEELALYSTPTIESIIRKAMADDTSIALDSFLIDAIAGSATRPPGLLNGVSPLTATAAGTPAEKMSADLKQLIGAIITNGGGRNVVVLMNPMQMLALGLTQTTTGDFLFSTPSEAGQKYGVTFVSSLTVPAGRVIAIDAADFIAATGDTPQFAVSNEATLHMEDTTPLAIGTPGTPNVVAAPVQSLFQTDSIAIRMHMYVSWAMRRSGMISTIASVGW